MKCKGVIHPELMEALTSLGHTDSFMLCDAGFPIPAGARRIDLALTPGVPSFRTCLNAILQEVIVEAFSLAEEMKAYNPETFNDIMTLFPRQQRTVAPQTEFLVHAQSRARFRNADVHGADARNGKAKLRRCLGQRLQKKEGRVLNHGDELFLDITVVDRVGQGIRLSGFCKIAAEMKIEDKRLFRGALLRECSDQNIDFQSDDVNFIHD